MYMVSVWVYIVSVYSVYWNNLLCIYIGQPLVTVLNSIAITHVPLTFDIQFSTMIDSVRVYMLSLIHTYICVCDCVYIYMWLCVIIYTIYIHIYTCSSKIYIHIHTYPIYITPHTHIQSQSHIITHIIITHTSRSNKVPPQQYHIQRLLHPCHYALLWVPLRFCVYIVYVYCVYICVRYIVRLMYS